MRSNDWLPIETAPRNPEGKFFGPVILVWCIADKLPWPAQFAEGGPDNEGCWRVIDEGRSVGSEIYQSDASHWMPIAVPWPTDRTPDQ